MKATFERAPDGQVVIRLAPELGNNPDEILIDEFFAAGEPQPWVYEGVQGSLLLYPNENQNPGPPV